MAFKVGGVREKEILGRTIEMGANSFKAFSKWLLV